MCDIQLKYQHCGFGQNELAVMQHYLSILLLPVECWHGRTTVLCNSVSINVCIRLPCLMC